MSTINEDSTCELFEKVIGAVNNKRGKDKVDNALMIKQAKVIGYDSDTYKAFVYFVDDLNQTNYTLYNKTGEILSEGDTVKVYYTSNPAKGWIGVRMGEPVSHEGSEQDSNANQITEYEYLTDKSVKYNGLTYTVETDADTGLISKISDNSGNLFKPKINRGINDTTLHNAVFWAVAMHSGFGRVPERLLYTGENGKAEFSGGLTGFKEIRGSWQMSAESGIYYRSYTNGCRIFELEKMAALSYEHDGYTDTIVIRSNEKIDLTNYRKLRVEGIVFQNYPEGLTAAAYFAIGEPPAAPQGTAYDFTGWKKIDSTKYYSLDYVNPGDLKIYDIDISKISGEQFLNFAVYHGSEWYTNSTYLHIKKIVLVP